MENSLFWIKMQWMREQIPLDDKVSKQRSRHAADEGMVFEQI